MRSKIGFLLLLIPLASVAHAELIVSYNNREEITGPDGSISHCPPGDWSNAVETPSGLAPKPTVKRMSGLGVLSFGGWGPAIDPEKYVGFTVSAKAGQRLQINHLKGVNTASNRPAGTEITSFVWAYRIDDDRNGTFEQPWTFGKTYTNADGEAFRDESSFKDWFVNISTKGTVEFGVFATAVDANRTMSPAFVGTLSLEGISYPIGDLDAYQYAHSYDIPVSEASGIAYNWDTDTLFSIGDEGFELVEVSKTGQRLSAMPFNQAKDNKAMSDPEGVSYLGAGKFIISEERRSTAVVVTYDSATRPSLADLLPTSYDMGINAGNTGMEGAAYDPINDSVWAVREIGPVEIREMKHFTAVRAGQTPVVTQPIERRHITRTGCDQLSDIYVMAQSTYFPATHPRHKNILLLARGADKVIEITRAGEIVGVLDFSFLHLDTVEGLTMDNDGNIYLVSEQNVGVGDSPQMHVFNPGSPAPLPSTAAQVFARETYASVFRELGVNSAVALDTPGFTEAFTKTLEQGRNEVVADPGSYDLFTETSIQDLRGNGVIVRVEGNEVNLSLPVQTSDLTGGGGWQDSEVEMKATFPKTGDKAFYRLTLPQD